MDNGLMRDYWNGEGGKRWIAANERVERAMVPISELLFAWAGVQRGERVVDIGCGLGRTTVELSRQSGVEAFGLDISEPMIERARAMSGARFELGDASEYAFGERFDLMFSRFGVMFFADPAAAFRHLRTGARRLAFVCWQPFAQNPWAFDPFMAARPLLPPQEPQDPTAPGPFAFGDRERLRGILEGAGWREVAIEPRVTTMHLGDTLPDAVDEAMTVGPLARAANGLPDDTRGKIRELLASALRVHETPHGVAPPAAVWLVRAVS
jgi:SAM-dependent methyltransferase